MKRFPLLAFRQSSIVDLLKNSRFPLTIYDIEGHLNMHHEHAMHTLRDMRLHRRVTWITLRRVHFYGPAK